MFQHGRSRECIRNEFSTTSSGSIVIRQGGNGLGTVVAALIIAGAAIYAINVWSTTKKETAPGKNLEQGIERLKEAAGQAMESRQ